MPDPHFDRRGELHLPNDPMSQMVSRRSKPKWLREVCDVRGLPPAIRAFVDQLPASEPHGYYSDCLDDGEILLVKVRCVPEYAWMFRTLAYCLRRASDDDVDQWLSWFEHRLSSASSGV